jgi:hypothetical protein
MLHERLYFKGNNIAYMFFAGIRLILNHEYSVNKCKDQTYEGIFSFYWKTLKTFIEVCAVAQAVIRWISILAALVRDRRKSSVRSVLARAALGQVSSEYFEFPANHSFHQLLHTHGL